MKKIRLTAMILALLTAVSAATACADQPVETLPVTETETDVPTETQEPETTAEETYDPALDNSAVEQDEDGNVVGVKEVDPGLLVGVDGLGRKLLTNAETGGVRENRTVGIFYSSWHGTFAGSVQAYNNQEILDKYPDIDINNFNDSRWGSRNYHFWNEPIYGYYSGNDKWVIRKQAELLADAGVDCIICDNTNGTYTWMDTAKNLMQVFHEAREDGVKAPTVTFLLPFGANSDTRTQLRELYAKIYKAEWYPDSWTMWDGKPLIIAYKASLDRKDPTDKEIYSYFTYREGQPGYLSKQSGPRQWGWLSVYPQATYKEKTSDKVVEQITVGVAQNYNYVAKDLTAMNGKNVADRTYTSKGYDTREDAALYGANFEEQFEYALQVDPEFIFITGWNEWVAIRQAAWPPEGHSKAGVIKNAFADQFDDKASRDIEPTKGKLKDHYYYQMVNFIRRYKGVDPLPEASAAKTVDIYGGFGQWASVLPEYNSYAGNTGARDSLGYINPKTNSRFKYTDESGRNDIYDAKVAQDKDNVYFMVRCVNEITPYTDGNWMRLYLDVSDTDKNWESFDFILNKTSPKDGHTATLEAFTGEGFETNTVGDVEYNVSGNVLTVKIPRSMLGIGDGAFTVDFKWADNSADGDIMDFYTKGDAAPGGRFKFRYTSK
ncbi:MAG: hypothetical protein J5879_02295 [Clostridia bacterium]|nr:hypothetical protein [Clostridia bacterium]